MLGGHLDLMAVTNRRCRLEGGFARGFERYFGGGFNGLQAGRGVQVVGV